MSEVIKVMTLKIKHGYENRGFQSVCSNCGKIIKVGDNYHRKKTGSPDIALRCVPCAKTLKVI